VEDVDQSAFLALLSSAATSCDNKLYRPNTLESPFHPWRYRVKGITFQNVSFKQTTISDFEFTNCTFRKCLFISTIFRNCRFTSCRFLDCNPHRAEFRECFVDPSSFAECIPERRYANIGVYIFQELLRNSRQLAQPDFADEAQYHFRRWKRFQLREELRKDRSGYSQFWMGLRFFALLVFDLTTGSAMRLGRFAMSAFALLLIVSIVNWWFAGPFGLHEGTKIVGGFVEAFYFSTVVMTTVGFGDVVPATRLGRLVISGEAILGFSLFALLTSTMYRRFCS
jgi:Ion channel/Pentapeptide repeats (9 copies)